MCEAVAAASAGMITAALPHATTAEAVTIDEMIVGVTLVAVAVIDAMIDETTDAAEDFGATAPRAEMDPVTPALQMHLVGPTSVGPCCCSSAAEVVLRPTHICPKGM